MDILLFIAIAVVLTLAYIIYGSTITRGYGLFTRGTASAWGRSYQPADDGVPVSRRRFFPGRQAGPQSIDSLAGSHWRNRLLRWTMLLLLLVLEVYAAQHFFGSVWLGLVAWAGMALISYAL